MVSAGPVRFKDSAGHWTDNDLTLTPGPAGALVAKAAPVATRLGPRADGAVASVDTPAGTVALRHPDAAANVAATVAGTTPPTPAPWAAGT